MKGIWARRLAFKWEKVPSSEMRGTPRETARVMETARTRREKAKRTAGFCGLPLGFRVRFGKWDATLEVGGCSCAGKGESGTRLVPPQLDGWGSCHCGTLRGAHS